MRWPETIIITETVLVKTCLVDSNDVAVCVSATEASMTMAPAPVETQRSTLTPKGLGTALVGRHTLTTPKRLGQNFTLGRAVRVPRHDLSPSGACILPSPSASINSNSRASATRSLRGRPVRRPDEHIWCALPPRSTNASPLALALSSLDPTQTPGGVRGARAAAWHGGLAESPGRSSVGSMSQYGARDLSTAHAQTLEDGSTSKALNELGVQSPTAGKSKGVVEVRAAETLEAALKEVQATKRKEVELLAALERSAHREERLKEQLAAAEAKGVERFREEDAHRRLSGGSHQSRGSLDIDTLSVQSQHEPCSNLNQGVDSLGPKLELSAGSENALALVRKQAAEEAARHVAEENARVELAMQAELNHVRECSEEQLKVLSKQLQEAEQLRKRAETAVHAAEMKSVHAEDALHAAEIRRRQAEDEACMMRERAVQVESELEAVRAEHTASISAVLEASSSCVSAASLGSRVEADKGQLAVTSDRDNIRGRWFGKSWASDTGPREMAQEQQCETRSEESSSDGFEEIQEAMHSYKSQ